MMNELRIVSVVAVLAVGTRIGSAQTAIHVEATDWVGKSTAYYGKGGLPIESDVRANIGAAVRGSNGRLYLISVCFGASFGRIYDTTPSARISFGPELELDLAESEGWRFGAVAAVELSTGTNSAAYELGVPQSSTSLSLRGGLRARRGGLVLGVDAFDSGGHPGILLGAGGTGGKVSGIMLGIELAAVVLTAIINDQTTPSD